MKFTQADHWLKARRALSIGALALVFLMLAGPVFADTYDGFDNYVNSDSSPVTQPGPWTLSLDGAGSSNSCWQNSGFTPALVTGVYTDNLPNGFADSRTSPNTYMFVFSPSCAGAHTAVLSMSVNATGPSLNFTFYTRAVANGGATQSDLQVNVCGNNFVTPYSNTNYPTTYTKVSYTGPAVPGTPCTVFIEANVPACTPSCGFVWFMEDTVILGGNPVITPSDVQFLNAQTRLTYNFLPATSLGTLPGTYGASGGTFQIQYLLATTCGAGLTQLSPTTCQQNIVTTSYANVPLSGATLLTVHVGNFYYRSLIPLSTTHQNVYLDDPSKVVQYTFTVTDVSGVFAPGSNIYVSQGTATITSGYLDSQSSFAAALVPGAYNFQIVQGSTTYSTTVNLEAPNNVGPTTVPITITKFVKPSSVGFVNNLAYSLAWTCDTTGLLAFYTDSSALTTGITATLYNQTSTGTFIVGSPQSITGTVGAVQFAFPHILAADGSYFVIFKVSNAQGTQFLGPVSVSPSNPSCPSTFPGFLPSLPAFPIAVFGLNQILPNANGYSEIIALTIIVLTAAVFSARSSSVGGVVLSIEVLWFFLALFIPSSYTIIYTFVISSMVGFLLYRRRRTALVGQ